MQDANTYILPKLNRQIKKFLKLVEIHEKIAGFCAVYRQIDRNPMRITWHGVYKASIINI